MRTRGEGRDPSTDRFSKLPDVQRMPPRKWSSGKVTTHYDRKLSDQ